MPLDFSKQFVFFLNMYWLLMVVYHDHGHWTIFIFFGSLWLPSFISFVACTQIPKTHLWKLATSKIEWQKECGLCLAFVFVRTKKINKKKENIFKLKGFTILSTLIRIECHLPVWKRKKKITTQKNNRALNFSFITKATWSYTVACLLGEFNIRRTFIYRKMVVKTWNADNWKNGWITVRCSC